MNVKVLPCLKLMRLHKPVGIILLLWPTLWALWISAQGGPEIKIVIVFLLGVIIMRSAGCVINDIADRNFDGNVARTKERPLITGEISLKQAVMLFIILSLMGFVLVLQLNVHTILLSFIGILFATLYPFSKRITHFPQVILGAAYSWSIPMAFSAQTNPIPPVCWLLYAIAILWPIAYDSIYALMDKEDDIKIGVKSTVIYFDRFAVPMIFFLQGLFVMSLCALGILLKMNMYYYFGIIIATILICYQYYLVTNKKYFEAFLNNQWVGLAVFTGIVINYFVKNFLFVV